MHNDRSSGQNQSTERYKSLHSMQENTEISIYSQHGSCAKKGRKTVYCVRDLAVEERNFDLRILAYMNTVIYARQAAPKFV